jgi:hypothetical protein
MLLIGGAAFLPGHSGIDGIDGTDGIDGMVGLVMAAERTAADFGAESVARPIATPAPRAAIAAATGTHTAAARPTLRGRRPASTFGGEGTPSRSSG